ncbi:hypothetical protein [Iamia sp.]|uniref:hypothetical protein n=1 Tax=Iamia sp. TaxID=2722710 RepID=UPI002CCAF8A2|nr:hypothetical protein [Iamia sp.]HXH58080.1 hypothetical protein [Iamia sp.]
MGTARRYRSAIRPLRSLPVPSSAPAASLRSQARHRVDGRETRPRPTRSIGSAGSILSIGSAGSILSIGSAGSILSIGSAGSILSIGSVASMASIASAGSIASIGSAAGIASIGRSGSVGARPRRTAPDRAVPTVACVVAVVALVTVLRGNA